VVTAAVGVPHGVLVRALEPADGLEWMRRRRGRDELTNGPARLVQALGLGPELQGHVLRRPPVWIAAGAAVPDEYLVRTPRIGIRQAADWPWRFFDGRSSWVSRR